MKLEAKKYFVRSTFYSKETAIIEIEVDSDDLEEGETIEQYCHRLAQHGDLPSVEHEELERYDYDFERLSREEMEWQNKRIKNNNKSMAAAFMAVGAEMPESRNHPLFNLDGMSE